MPSAPNLLSSVLGHSSFLKVPHKMQRVCYNPVAELLQSGDKEERASARGLHPGPRRQKRLPVSRLGACLCSLLETNCAARSHLISTPVPVKCQSQLSDSGRSLPCFETLVQRGLSLAAGGSPLPSPNTARPIIESVVISAEGVLRGAFDSDFVLAGKMSQASVVMELQIQEDNGIIKFLNWKREPSRAQRIGSQLDFSSCRGFHQGRQRER